MWNNCYHPGRCNSQITSRRFLITWKQTLQHGVDSITIMTLFSSFLPLVLISFRNLSRTLAKLYYNHWKFHCCRNDFTPNAVDPNTASPRPSRKRAASQTHFPHLRLFQHYLWCPQNWYYHLPIRLCAVSKRMVYSLLKNTIFHRSDLPNDAMGTTSAMWQIDCL